VDTRGYGSEANDNRRDIFNNTFDREEFAPRQAEWQPPKAPSLRTCPNCATSNYYLEENAAGRKMGYCMHCVLETDERAPTPA